MTRPRDDDPHYDREAVEAVYRRMGMRPPHPDYPKNNHVIRVSEQAYTGLQQLALANGYTRSGGGSVSGFLEALGLGMFADLEWRVDVRGGTAS